VSINLYECPKADLTPPPLPELRSDNGNAPPYLLYSPGDVFVAAFLGGVVLRGGVLGGVVLMVLNYRRLRRWEVANQTLIIGVVVQMVVAVVAFFSRDIVPGIFVTLGVAAGAWGTAKALQEGPFALHMACGGKKASTWKAAGIGLLSGLIVSLVYIIVVLLLWRLADQENEFLFWGG
jgi:hypothetical protein